ncbi:MAG: hypothetical protein ACJ72D_16750 [Marmoricola sp.]
MLAYYLHRPRAASLDRTRAVVEALPGDVVVVSPGPAPWGWPTPWHTVASDDPSVWSTWVRANRPDHVVVDGSAEHVTAVRDSSVTVAVLAEPGDPGDGPLTAAYRAADLVLAPWASTGRDEPCSPPGRTVHLGAIGWAAGQVAAGAVPARRPRSAGWSCVVLSAAGGGMDPRSRRDLVLGSPGWSWWFAPERDLLVPHGPIWDRLRQADVVVCAPVQQNLAALVATRSPALLLLPDHAPASQHFLASLAAGSAPAVASTAPRTHEQWRALLTRVRGLDGRAWATWDPVPRINLLDPPATARRSLSGAPLRLTAT